MNSHLSPPFEKMAGLKDLQAGTSPGRIVLQIRNVGHIPSKKNHHYPGANGRLLIDKSVKNRLKLLEDAIVSELLLAYRTNVTETETACSLRSWTLSSIPEDDCWQSIPEIELKVRLLPEPTLEITIEELP